MEFNSVPEASRALGLNETTVYWAIAMGRTDFLGLGKGNHRNQIPPRCQSFSIGAFSWKSKAEAARALAYKPKTFQKMIRHGRMDEILGRAMQVLR